MRTLCDLGLSALLVLIASAASASPALEARVRQLETELRAARAELATMKQPVRYYVHCSRGDLERPRPPMTPALSQDIGRVLERLSGLPVDPVYDQATWGMEGAVPTAFMVRPGCSFLGGDRITHIDDQPLTDLPRVRERLRHQTEWKFTVSERRHLGKKVEAYSEQTAFDLAKALGVSGTEAKVVPYSADNRERGFMVWSVTPGGYLSSAGLEPRDILVSVNRIELSHRDAEAIISREWKAKGRLDLEVLRDGRPFFLRSIAASPRTR